MSICHICTPSVGSHAQYSYLAWTIEIKKVKEASKLLKEVDYAGERKKVTFWSRCCPRVVSTRRRFYSRKGALVSEAVRLLKSFSSWLIDKVLRSARMCTCSMVACVYMCIHARACK